MKFTSELMKKAWRIAKANPSFKKSMKGVGSYWSEAIKVVQKITKDVKSGVVKFFKWDGSIHIRKVIPASQVNPNYLDFTGGFFLLFDTEKKGLYKV